MKFYRSPDLTEGGSINQLSIPVPETDRQQIINDRRHMALASDVSLNFNNSLIPVSEIIKYYQNTTGTFTGIRFYPALISGGIFLIMCLSDLDQGTDSNYLLLKSTPESITKPQAMSYITLYWEQVLIDNEQQSATDVKFKKSRFYYWTALLNYFTVNIPNFDLNDPTSYADYSLKIEPGYVSEEIADLYFNTYHIILYPGLTEIDLIGYTTILSIISNGNIPLIDPNAVYEEGNYYRRYLEMAASCPPKCGSTF